MPDMKTPNNTRGAIQSAAQRGAPSANLPVAQSAGSEKMKDLITTEQVRSMFRNALKERADQFLSSVIDLYNNDRALQACAPREVLMECLKAATLDLPINKQLGLSWIVPYEDRKLGKTVPTFQVGYKGYIQLCLRSGVYRHINADVVYEGEFVSQDRLTGEVDLSGTRVSDKLAGFVAYIETVNGFSKALYWPVAKMNAHAKRYSKSYGYDSSPWSKNYEEMGCKTVLRQLLSKYGIMTIDLQNAVSKDIADAADEQLQDETPAAAPETAVDVTPPSEGDDGTDSELPFTLNPEAK